MGDLLQQWSSILRVLRESESVRVPMRRLSVDLVMHRLVHMQQLSMYSVGVVLRGEWCSRLPRVEWLLLVESLRQD